ncbi:MAG: UvrD-helicase domain-containing protein [Bacteroidales bacterium]|nr:UvrD-helicase domain-containing protein [Bacteroidales bacterium]
MGKLLVYSASAGSGKTHNIAGQYLMLLFSKSQAHKNILAVTFTNKACEEMKTRIVEEMHNITKNNSENRINEIHDFTDLPKNIILKQSKRIFKEILHDYSHFSVLTIDSFFQKIIRNFTRETGIQYNYEIELDKEIIISKAVDDLMSQSESDKELKNNIIALVQQNIDNSTKWDFRYNLKSFLKMILESDYRSYEKEYNDFFADKNNLFNFFNELNELEDEFIYGIKNLCSKLEQTLKNNGLEVANFSGGNARSIIRRMLATEQKVKEAPLKTNEHFNHIDNIDKWLKQADIGKEPLTSTTNVLMQITQNLLDFYIEHHNIYYTSRIIKKQLPYTALINKSLQTVHKNLYESGKFLISEVPVFLSEIATQNSSSFIYEKTGSFYENYLIDEFQDTSRIQWDSFKPLLSESLSVDEKGRLNILVGDLKQSIYSWRGGDWQLLAIDVEKEFPYSYKKIPLLDNWRSGKTIVHFNNEFFNTAAKILKNTVNTDTPEKFHSNTGNLITDIIYSEIKQNTQKDFESAVQIDIFNESEDTKSDIIKNMILQIEDLQLKNYNPEDMMILVRRKTDGTRIAEEIIKHSQSEHAKPGVSYDVISSEALLISANKAVKLIISCLQYLSSQTNELAFNEAAYSYYVQQKLKNQEIIVFNKQTFGEYLETNLKPIKQTYHYKLLHETCDSLIKILELNKSQENIPFLNSFRDLLHDFSQNNHAEVDNFLEYWEEKGKTQNLRIPEKQNAINIITIHKAKGLDANFVFIPFTDWGLFKYNNTIWVKSEIAPFKVLPAWPANFDTKLANSIFEKDFYDYKFKQIVESFNMLYVAFTRARIGLFMSAPQKSCLKNTSIANILKNGIDELAKNNIIEFEITSNEELTTYKCGNIPDTIKTESEQDYIKSYDVFIPDKQIKIKPFYEKDNHESKTDSNIIEGIKMHKIYENINLANDLNKALLKLSSTGIISTNDIEYYKSKISKTLKHNFIKPWFDGTYKVYNEAEILSSEGKIRRPDRIMEKDDELIIVDYKFGDIEKQQYIKQTKNYALLLDELGYKNIKTYIWFVMHDYLIEVNVENDKTDKIILN